MRSLVTSLVGVAVVFAIAHPATAKKNNPNISLEFIPQQAVAGAVANVQGAMLDKPVALRFKDGRRSDDPKVIGKRSDDDDRWHVLTATSDVVEFVEQNLVESAQRWGVDFDSESSLVLEMELLEFDLLETNQAVGATYNSKVRLAYSFRQGSGQPRVQSTAVGDATRYGKKFSNDNCNEVLSDALLEAVAELFSDPALQRAWGE